MEYSFADLKLLLKTYLINDDVNSRIDLELALYSLNNLSVEHRIVCFLMLCDLNLKEINQVLNVYNYLSFVSVSVLCSEVMVELLNELNKVRFAKDMITVDNLDEAFDLLRYEMVVPSVNVEEDIQQLLKEDPVFLEGDIQNDIVKLRPQDETGRYYQGNFIERERRVHNVSHLKE